MTDQVDWEGLKALEAKATQGTWIPCTGDINLWVRLDGDEFGAGWRQNRDNDRLFVSAWRNAFPAILAQHERDQRVIQAAEKLASAIRTGPCELIDAALAEFDKAKAAG